MDFSQSGLANLPLVAENFLLDKLDFQGKSVLNLGCREGSFAFHAEAMGAKSVLAIEDPRSPARYVEKFASLKSKLKSKVEHKLLKDTDLHSLQNKFDIILLSDYLNLVSDPDNLLSFVHDSCLGDIWLFSNFMLDNSEVPIAAMLRNYSPEPYFGAKRAVNLAWILNLMDANSLGVSQAKIHPNMRVLSIICKKQPGLKAVKKLSFDEMPMDDQRLEQTAVLVMSCKKFEQIWDPFFILFKRYWPDCPYKVYFCTDIGNYPGVETIEIGKDLGWSSNCRFALEKIPQQRFILLQDDFLFTAPVDTKRVRKYAEHAHAYNIGCLRLSPVPGATADWYGTSELGVIQPFDDYRLSMQIAIWKKQLFHELLVEGETPWQVEIEGTKRASIRPEIFLSTWETAACPIPYFITAVEKGYWKEGALELLDKEGIPRTHINKKVY